MRDVWLRVSKPRGRPVVFGMIFDDGVLRESAPYYWGIKQIDRRERRGPQIAKRLRELGFTVEALA